MIPLRRSRVIVIVIGDSFPEFGHKFIDTDTCLEIIFGQGPFGFWPMIWMYVLQGNQESSVLYTIYAYVVVHLGH
jgi:hypothetical protein